ncbi:MAG: penicillin-binding protein 2 [Candidatus Komeilibacteria bacterium]|nr:penicillin-binding protein 2 [Candidatus Komeilibacteria bacterium]
MKDKYKIFPSSLENVFKEGGLRNWLHNNNAGNFISEEEFSPFWLGHTLTVSKVNFLKALLVIIFLIFFSRLAYLQIYQGDHFRAIAEGNRIKEEYLVPRRGIIFDRFEKPLVSNNGSFSLVLNKLPRNIDKQSLAGEYNFLEPYFVKYKKNIAAENVWQEMVKKATVEPQVLIEDLEYNDALKLKLTLPEADVVSVMAEAERQYGGGGAWAHILGYLGRIKPEDKDKYLKNNYQLTERVGLDGLEAVYEADLHGQEGVRQLEVNSLGKIIDELTLQPEQAGANLYTTLDADLSEFILKILKTKVPRSKGAVVVMNPQNGQILAMISWPVYDSNMFHHTLTVDEVVELFKNPLQPLFNRAISGQYPSGSTIKMVYAAAGLAEGVITKTTTVLSTGGIHLGEWFFADWKAGGHGVTNVIKALSESVNTFFYILGAENYQNHTGLGLIGMQKYLKLFGIDAKTGIDLLHEAAGFIPSKEWKLATKKEAWYPGDTLHLAIGQGDLLVTPLQVANYTAAIANGGILYKPYLVASIKREDNQSIKEFNPQIIRSNFISDNVLAIVREGLRTTVTSGSARSLNDLPYEIAGKTGTAQVDTKNLPHAWFSGFMPYENPSLVVTVLVENGGEGSSIATPIAKEIFSWYAEHRLKEE